jgi:hypothetical protein
MQELKGTHEKSKAHLSSVSVPDPVRSALNSGLDPGSGSAFEIRIPDLDVLKVVKKAKIYFDRQYFNFKNPD